MRNTWMGVVLVLGICLTGALAGQSPATSDDPAVLLQAAMHLEQVEGRLAQAIEAYKNVVAKAGANKAVAAQALLQLGAAYEKLGRAEARATYERLVKAYPNEAAAGAARTRLAKLTSEAGTVTLARAQQEFGTPRRVLEGQDAGLVDASRDGRFAVGSRRRGYQRSDLVVRDLRAGNVSLLVESTQTQSPAQPRISDDGTHVAYSWPEGGDIALRVVGTGADARPRTIVRTPGMRFTAADWSPDGRSLVVSIVPAADPAKATLEWSRLGLVDVETGTVRTLKTFDGWHSWGSLMTAAFSPDGRLVAYTRQPRQGTDDRYLEVIDVATGEVSTVVGTAAPRYTPMWTPDGAHLVYAQGYEGQESLQAVRVRGGRAVGDPFTVLESFEGRILTMTPAGALLSRRQVGGGNFTHVLDRRPGSSSRLVTFEGFGASWSPDGRAVAFVRNRGNDVVVIVRDVSTGEERSFVKSGLLSAITPQWTADGSALLLQGRGEGIPTSFHRLDIRSGASQVLFARDTHAGQRGIGALAPDGRTVFLAKANEAGTAVTAIVAVDAATGAERTVVALDAPVEAGVNAVWVSVAVSPDGRTLAVMHYTAFGNKARIFTVGVDGSGMREVVGSVDAGWVGYGSTLRWAPDGQSLIFLAFDANRNWRIMRVPASGGAPVPDGLDYDTLQALLPGKRLFAGNTNGFDVSPDGSRIVVSTFTVSMTEVWSLDNVPGLIARK